MDFNGKPMFMWNVLKCRYIFNRVYVSSDNDWILSEASEAGAIPIKRGEELCGDTPNIPVYRHALQYMGDTNVVVAVQANSPTLDSSLIVITKYLMERWRYNEIMTCNKDLKTYGSIWALTRKRIMDYKDFYKPEPEVLIVDPSTDIHDNKDFQKALCQFK